MRFSPRICMMFLVILLGCILSCSDNNNPIKPITKMTIDDFPHEIGTVWQYQRDDRLLMKTDTLFVRIDDTTRITNDSLFVYMVISDFVTTFADSSDTSYWHINSDTITYYIYESDTFIIDRKIILPLELGDTWTTGSFPPDSNDVLQIRQKTVLGKSYQNAYQIVRTGGALNDYVIDSYWLVPNIGLIQINQNRISLGPVKDETWDLISFHEPDSFELSDFPLRKNTSWTYKVFNNLIDCAQLVDCFDTCTITIIDSIYESHDSISQNWTFNYPDKESVNKQSISQNKLFLQWHHEPVFFSLQFPLTVGKRWQDGQWNISRMQVLGRQPVTTEFGTYENAYYLKGTTSGFELGATFYIWIVKGIGIVKLSHQGSGTNFNHQNKSWELTNYIWPDISHLFTIDKFPNYDGIQRTYETYNQLTRTYDTVFVQVAESSTVAIWSYTNSDSTWVELVSVEGNVAKYFYPNNIHEPFKSIQFPIEVGNKWITYPQNSSSEVRLVTVLRVRPNERFFPAFIIQTIYENNSAGIKSEYEIFTPYMGMIHNNVVSEGSNTGISWHLIDYYNP